MKKYELVIVIDANLSSSLIKETKQEAETLFGRFVLETDEIGLMSLAYPLRGQDQAYFISYCVELDLSFIDELKSQLALIKGVAKFFLFKMSDRERFLVFSDLEKRYMDLFPIEEEVLDAQEEGDEGEANLGVEKNERESDGTVQKNEF